MKRYQVKSIFSLFWNQVKSAPWHRYLWFSKNGFMNFHGFLDSGSNIQYLFFPLFRTQFGRFLTNLKNFQKCSFLHFWMIFLVHFWQFYAFKIHANSQFWYWLSMQKTTIFYKKNVIFIKKWLFFPYVRWVCFDTKAPYLSTFSLQKFSHFET